ncbi:hypothetical protein [Devosia submarina]|uniref:hypothetical protein n=1 Tax=Devosia submarina TaxID=1173082 RepID=UPI000D38204E|nr:hypothetical protein [Devosia submarina]
MVAGMRFRPAEGEDKLPGLGFNGADLRLVLLIWSAFGQLLGKMTFDQETVFIPQRVISSHFGRVQPDRLEKSIRRIAYTDVWDGMDWHPLIENRHRHPGVQTNPRIMVGDVWGFTIPESLRAVLIREFGAMRRWASFRIDSSDLQQLESKHSISLLCRYRAWMSGYAKPEGAVGFAMHPSKKGLAVEVMSQDLPRLVFGHDGHLAPSQIQRLFVTEAKTKPPIWMEMRRIGIDLQVVPLTTVYKGEHAYDVRIADVQQKRVTTGLGSLDAALKMEKVAPARKKITHRRKRGLKSAEPSNAT